MNLELSGIRALRAPNIWGDVPILEATLDWELTPSATGVEERASKLLGASQAEFSAPRRLVAQWQETGRLEFLSDALAQLVLAIQIAAGEARVAFADAAEDRITVEIEQEDFGRQCLFTARNLLAALLSDESFDLVAELARLRGVAEQQWVGFTHAMARAALKRRIPVRSLNSGSLFQLGHGFRQRRVWNSETDRTSSIGAAIGFDKQLAKELLRAVGVPVPPGRLVTSAEDACRAAGEIGGDVVVKPQRACHGRGITIGIRSPHEVRSAFECARAESDAVLVERFITGAEHRLLVVNGRVAAASRGDALYVTGDAERSIAEFVAELNADPRRAPADESPLYAIEFDHPTLAVLAQQGYGPDSVPAAGARVLVQRNGNQSTDVTDLVHPGNAAIAVLAAATIGVDVAGVDIVADDISRPLAQQGGAVLEVNSQPGLMMHLQPAAGTARPVNETILEYLFPEGCDGRIPLVAVHGPDSTSLARDIAQRSQGCGRNIGLACASGTLLNGQVTHAGNRSSAGAVTDLLLHPFVEIAIVETTDAGVLSEGLGFDECQIAVMLGPVGDIRVGHTLLKTVAAGGMAFLSAGIASMHELISACRGEIVVVADCSAVPSLVARRLGLDAGS